MITSGVATAAGTAITNASLIHVPAGPATVLLANSGTGSPVYFGSGTNVTTSNGFPVPSGAVSPVVIPVPAGCAATTMAVVCAVASGTSSMAWMISTPSGQIGTGTLD